MRKKDNPSSARAAQLRSGPVQPFRMLDASTDLGGRDMQLYRSVRDAIPILDAAVGKLIRLVGGFTVECPQPEAQAGLRRFLQTVNTGRGQHGMDSFFTAYLDSLLTYGRAVGEVIVRNGRPEAVLWGDVTKLQVQEGDSPLDFALGVWENGQLKILPRQELLLFSVWNASADCPYGCSLFHSMPFFANILLKIFSTIGSNWERAGNVRYSVVYRPKEDAAERSFAAEQSEQMAKEWAAAMQDSKNGAVRDFVAVGDVEIKVIGADGQILDSEVPVRQILEQLVAKTGLPPFLLGLSWSATERMSAQQSDLLTSELWAIRRSVQPVLERVCRLWLRGNGFGCEPEIIWDEISLQDLVEQAHAELYRAQAESLRAERKG